MFNTLFIIPHLTEPFLNRIYNGKSIKKDQLVLELFKVCFLVKKTLIILWPVFL